MSKQYLKPFEFESESDKKSPPYNADEEERLRFLLNFSLHNSSCQALQRREQRLYKEQKFLP